MSFELSSERDAHLKEEEGEIYYGESGMSNNMEL